MSLPGSTYAVIRDYWKSGLLVDKFVAELSWLTEVGRSHPQMKALAILSALLFITVLSVPSRNANDAPVFSISERRRSVPGSSGSARAKHKHSGYVWQCYGVIGHLTEGYRFMWCLGRRSSHRRRVQLGSWVGFWVSLGHWFSMHPARNRTA